MIDDEFKDINELTPDELVGEEIEQIVTKKEPVKESEKKPAPKKEVELVKEEVKVEGMVDKPKEKPAAKSATTKKKTTKKKAASKKKKAKKKETPKTIIVDEETSGDKWLTIIVSAIAVLAIALGIYFIFTSVTVPEEADTVAAVVNGQAITNKEVDTRFNILKNTQNPYITREEALNETINQKLLVQEAEKEGFKVTSAELDAIIENTLASNGMTEEEFEQSLLDSGLDLDSLMDFYEENLLSFKYVNSTIISAVSISEDEAMEYYEENTELFKVPERVQVRHILIGFEGDDENETRNQAEEIADEIDEDKSNFCDLVEEYTTDIASKDTCGEYNFSESDLLVPEFLEAGFDMEIDEVRTVKTQFGYHIIWKIATLPEGTLSFEDVEDSIIGALEGQKGLEEYVTLLQELKDKAIIEIYTNKGEEVPEEDFITEPEEETEVVEETQEETSSETEEEPEEDEPVIAETPRKDTVKTEESVRKSFTRCVAEAGAVMYTVYWAPDNKDQMEIFNDEVDLIEVVQCDPSNSRCEEFDFKTYPSWVVDEEVYEGIQSQMRLASATGCNY